MFPSACASETPETRKRQKVVVLHCCSPASMKIQPDLVTTRTWAVKNWHVTTRLRTVFRRLHDAPRVIDKAALLTNIALVASRTPQTMDLKQEDTQEPGFKGHTPVQGYIDISGDDARSEDNMHARLAGDDVLTDTAPVRDETMIKLEAQDNENHEDSHDKVEGAEDAASLSALTPIPAHDWQALYEDFDAAMLKQHQVEQDIHNETQRLMQVYRQSLLVPACDLRE